MPAIANYPDRCELLNLGYGPQGRGPFIIRQVGNVPGSMDLAQNPYFLRKDGVWVLNLAIIALPEADQEVVLYPTMVEAMARLGALAGGDPVIEATLPAGRSLQELQSAAEDTANRLIAHLRRARREPLSP
ncbi:MAG: hypothetical protein ACKV19_11275 [Verrucomicrobiales bacterium]